MVGGGACGVPAASPLWGSRSGSLMRGIPRLLAAGLRSGSPAQHMFPARSWNRSLLGLVVFSRARERPGTSVSGRKAPGNRLKGVTNDAPYKGVGTLPRLCCHWDVQRLVRWTGTGPGRGAARGRRGLRRRSSATGFPAAVWRRDSPPQGDFKRPEANNPGDSAAPAAARFGPLFGAESLCTGCTRNRNFGQKRTLWAVHPCREVDFGVYRTVKANTLS